MSNVEPYVAEYSTILMTDVWESAPEFVYDYKHVGIPTTISDANATTLFYLLYAKYGNNPIANYDITQFKYKMFSVIFQYGPTWEKKLSVQETLRGLQLTDLIDDGSLNEIFSHTGAENSSKNTTDGNTRTYQEAGTNTGTVGVSGQAEKINNHAFNPGTAPASDPYDPLGYINEQNAEKLTNSSTTTNNLADSKSGNITDSRSISDSIANQDVANNETNRTIKKGKLNAYEKLLELLDADVTGEFINKFKYCFKQFILPERQLWYVTEDDEEE